MDTAPSTVQHVTKASSDELLRKFAQTGDTKRCRKRTRPAAGVIDDQSAGLVERKSLLPPAADQRSAALIRRLGMGRSRLRARGFKNKSVLGTIQKVSKLHLLPFKNYINIVYLYSVILFYRVPNISIRIFSKTTQCSI